MSWFKRKDENIQTETKKEMPEGVWVKVPTTGETIHRRELEDNLWVDPLSGYHFRIGSKQYFSIIFDDNKFEELGQNIMPTDPLEFSDTKKYKDRLADSQKKSGLSDAARVGVGKMNGIDLVVGCMDFGFIGGSMGSVVGERLGIAIDHARENKIPLIIISQTGGARMMESVLSLMQMAKTSAKLAQLEEDGVPYISYMTHPTTGGVTASYAMLGDFNVAEPGALIAFAGPRVVRQTIGRDLPEGFQTAEYLLEHGFLDFIVPRNTMKSKLTKLLKLVLHKK
ncbi:MAG TPA: acetyl-CoA carboxylase carboxyl transferase subunit beta [Balneola sp.]|jgi:acetyl-CoA carboxylase carboxyl transferase subunit beta|nr:acetyl-CoA carboxylase carboxyl transferase subunit beta [Bacteroidota bacterium]MAC04554.1 acetyl-CoA carboxylase carboxyl transferase subunit beta [Balneola sp.]MAO76738.1 acetyl-CoA carboxylase carboxyl transferase subunit beta [Balneola sp.]MBF65145.1 acetyl-CoA carboxylase carboxyl transferase subunit beta [Balneola sp.]HCT53013.1 acetyl-CoA carboxylase carboxyl transferase subunit beta [Balneola sp.]|tara:strand:- start:37 stop:882 length:846 start_codon:yes stop_codon:yes gene_type:complete